MSKKKDKEMDDEVIRVMRERYTAAIAASSVNREAQRRDLKFYAGNSDNNYQWPDEIISDTNNNREIITVNKLPQYVLAIANNMRMSRPSLSVVPVDGGSDKRTAEIMNGIIRHIEAISNAEEAYDNAVHHQIVHGEGFFRVCSKYCDPLSFDQELVIRKIANPFSVYLDPNIQDRTGADAEWAMITSSMTESEFAATFPDAERGVSFSEQGVGDDHADWGGDDMVIIAEYYYKERTPITINLYGSQLIAEDGSEDDIKYRLLSQGGPLRTRSSFKEVIHHIKTNGSDILERTVWPGKTIPIIRVVGNEFNIDGVAEVSGVIRNSINAQQLYNYWNSLQVEILRQQPRTPYLAYDTQLKGHEQDWITANSGKLAVLRVNASATDGSGNPLPLPQRQQSAQPDDSLIFAMNAADDAIRATTGQYTGAQPHASDRSGKAILAKQRQSDVGTYHYSANFIASLVSLGRILVDVIPQVYDSDRVVRIINKDESVDTATISSEQEVAVSEHEKDDGSVEEIYNLGVGIYDVRAVTGPGYATQMIEAKEQLAQLVQTNPQLWGVIGDLLVSSFDFPMSDEIAERLRATMDPKILKGGDGKIEEMAQQIQQLQQELQTVAKELPMREMSVSERMAAVAEYNAETTRLAKISDKITPDELRPLIAGIMQELLEPGFGPPPAPPGMPPEMPPEMPPGMPPGMPPEMPPELQGMPPELQGQMNPPPEQLPTS